MNLPEQLKELMQIKRWVCHKNKVPMNPFTCGNAMVNEESTWGTYNDAISGMERFAFSGIGLQFRLSLQEAEALETERITGIDLDHVVREDGTLEPFAQKIINLIDSYTELSPSGNGIHILCKGKLYNIGRRKNVGNVCIIEIYNYLHYFTVTGNVYGTPKCVEERTSQLKELFEEYFSEPKKEVPNITEKHKTAETQKQRETHSSTTRSEYFSSDELSDSELLDRMFDSANGYSIERLFRGDFSSYSSHSEADLALMSHLAY